jgi:2,4-dienoyl-CoA reductase-like NADH-dependent reductase (Old Yellow Enzyme family)
MTEAQIQQKIDAFAEAALLAKQSGFDAVEIHAGHGYLLSQFLSPWTNHRQDHFGGSLENRVRFPAAVIRHVREAVGPGYPVLVKVNQSDGIEGGLELGEAVEVARRFEQEGASALIPSSGFVAKTPLHMMRGDVPTMEMVANQANWFTKLGLLLFGRTMVQEYPFERMYLLDGARQIADAVHVPVVYVGGALSLDDMVRAIQVGLQFVQVGRATVRDPDFAKKLESGEIVESDCDHCNRCIATIDAGGVYCVSNERGLVAR